MLKNSSGPTTLIYFKLYCHPLLSKKITSQLLDPSKLHINIFLQLSKFQLSNSAFFLFKILRALPETSTETNCMYITLASDCLGQGEGLGSVLKCSIARACNWFATTRVASASQGGVFNTDSSKSTLTSPNFFLTVLLHLTTSPRIFKFRGLHRVYMKCHSGRI